MSLETTGDLITRAELQNEVRVLYHALIDDFWYVSPKLDCLKADRKSVV